MEAMQLENYGTNKNAGSIGAVDTLARINNLLATPLWFVNARIFSFFLFPHTSIIIATDERSNLTNDLSHSQYFAVSSDLFVSLCPDTNK